MKFDEQNPTVKRIPGDVEAEGASEGNAEAVNLVRAALATAMTLIAAGKSISEIEAQTGLAFKEWPLLRVAYDELGRRRGIDA